MHIDELDYDLPDELIAQVPTDRREDARLLVLFGESHLAPQHLPRQVARAARRLGTEFPAVSVFQNPDELYWRALERDQRLPDAPRHGPTEGGELQCRVGSIASASMAAAWPAFVPTAPV